MCGDEKKQAAPQETKTTTTTTATAGQNKNKKFARYEIWLKKAKDAYGPELDEPTCLGIENLCAPAWKAVQNCGLEKEWLEAAETAIVALAIEKAHKAQLLFYEMVQLHISEKAKIASLGCIRCAVVGSALLVVEGCKEFHPLCEPCLRFVTLFWMANSPTNTHLLQCTHAHCTQEIAPDLVRSVLSAAEFNKYLDAANAVLLNHSSSGKMVTCPNSKCRAVMEFIPTMTMKGKEDKKAEPTDEHFRQNRLRCWTCQGNFCVACNEMPYHVGFTCVDRATFLKARHCLYCTTVITSNTAVICDQFDCLAKLEMACPARLTCGHRCFGIREEVTHLPCVHHDCNPLLNSKLTDFCNICWVEELGQAPLIQLACGHLFHSTCASAKLKKKWPGLRITFGFLSCSICNAEMMHPWLTDLKTPWLVLKQVILTRSMQRLRVENRLKDPKLMDSSSRYFENPEKYALDLYAYYECFKCQQPYFGGLRDCEQNSVAEDRPQSEFICFNCSPLINTHCHLKEHAEYHVWKCRFCCSTAIWFCFGTTHFCEPCHLRAYEIMRNTSFPVCQGPALCPLRTIHPPNGSTPDREHSLGCALCMEKRMIHERETKLENEAKPEEKEKKKENEEKEKEQKKDKDEKAEQPPAKEIPPPAAAAILKDKKRSLFVGKRRKT